MIDSVIPDIPDLDNVSDPEDLPEISTIAVYVIVFSRLLYSGFLAVGVIYLLGEHVLGLPSYTNMIGDNGLLLWNEMLTTNAGVWIPLAIMVAFIVIAAGFPMWVTLSWGTAWALCPSVREMMREAREAEDGADGDA